MPKSPTNVDVVSFGGNLTPEQILIAALEDCKADPESYDIIVIGVVSKDGRLFMGRSDGSALKVLGLLDWTMQQVRRIGLGSA